MADFALDGVVLVRTGAETWFDEGWSTPGCTAVVVSGEG